MGLFGGKSKTVKTESKQESFLHPIMKDYIKQGVDESMGGPGIPDYMLAQMTPDQLQALKGLGEGDANKGFQKWAGQFGQDASIFGKDSQQQGSNYLGQMGALGNTMANQDLSVNAGQIKDMAGQLYDQDRVNRQVDLVADKLNRDLRENQMQSIYRGAAGEGGVGSSRSAIAQGVAMRGTNEAIGNAAVQLNDAESLRALQSAQSQLNQNTANKLTGQQAALGAYGNAGGALMNAGQNSLLSSLNAMGQSRDAGTQALIQQLQAGNVQQGFNQKQLDLNWMNQLKNDNPTLSKLQMVNGTVLPMAGLSTTQTSTSTPQGGGGMLGSLMTIGGTAIGAWFGGPAGAAAGASAGSAVGGAMDG